MKNTGIFTRIKDGSKESSEKKAWTSLKKLGVQASSQAYSIPVNDRLPTLVQNQNSLKHFKHCLQATYDL